MDTLGYADPLGLMLAPEVVAAQPPLIDLAGDNGAPVPLFAVVASLALGGAERIVLDWAARAVRTRRVRLAVLHDAPHEWALPSGVELESFHGSGIEAKLATFGALAAGSCKMNGAISVCCHLLTAKQRRALRAGGVATTQVLHNAAPGWLDDASGARDDAFVIAVSKAAETEYRAAGGHAPTTVVRHFPRTPQFGTDARTSWRARWAISADAWVIGMIGGVKPQKAYTRALRILRKLLDQGGAGREAYLVIVGGPVGRDGALAWNATLAMARQLDLVGQVRLPGFIADASRCLPAFDVFLNTSRYEGLSIATLEALACGLPVVASDVGGQGEVISPGLSLLDVDAPDAHWASELAGCAGRVSQPPFWAGFPGDRQWTLAASACGFKPVRRERSRVLFVTANLNAGGAQRSLVNLALSLQGRLDFEIAVAGNSSSSAFTGQLQRAGVRHFRSASSRDCFDHAEALIEHIVRTSPSLVCFWNLDAKIKLLLVKWLGHTALRFVDVSPGDYLFDELRATQDFQQCIAYGEREYFARIDRLVQKFHAESRSDLRGKVTVIPNGVARPAMMRKEFVVVRPTPARVVMCGRIAPAKFVVEAIEAIRLVSRHGTAVELHVLGTAEARHHDYGMQVAEAARAAADEGVRIVFHGAAFDAPQRLAQFDAMLVLGQNQGCPNTMLEGLAAGVPVVANDSGGTRESILHGKTGLLVATTEPALIATALQRVLDDAALARSLSVRGLKHVCRNFSMERMRDRYFRLFQ